MAQAKYSPYYTYIKPVIQNRIIRSTAPTIFSLIALSVMIIFAIRPTISTILNLQKEIDNNHQVLDSLLTKEQNINQAKKNLDNISAIKREKIASSLPPDAELPTLIKQLQSSLGSTATISALQIQPLVIVDNTINPGSTHSIGKVEFSFNAQGPYDQLLTILNNLQTGPRLISLDNIVMTKQTDGPIILSITGQAYFMK